MKRIISFVLSLALFLCAASNSYAIEPQSSCGISPTYVGIILHSENFTLNDKGSADIYLYASQKSETSMNRIVAEVEIMKSSSVTPVYSHAYTMRYSLEYKNFTTSSTWTPSSAGIYTLHVTYQCYAGARLLESIPVLAGSIQVD